MSTSSTPSCITVEESNKVIGLKPQPVEKFRKDYTPPEYFIRKVYLSFLLDPEQTVVEADLELERNSGSPAGADLVLMGDELPAPEHVQLDGATLTPSQYVLRNDNDELVIPGHLLPVEASKTFNLATRVIINPSHNLKFMGLYISKGNYLTQCEAEGFRRITYFLDRPDVLSTYNVRIQGNIDEMPVILSNGNKVESGVDPDAPNQHYAYYVDPIPKSCYLFALVAGKYKSIKDTFTTMSGRIVNIEIVSEPDDVKKLDWAMTSIKLAMKWDEVNYGREYDLDDFYIVAAADFNMGAMENKGLNVFNNALLLTDPKTSTDLDYLRVSGVIAHEYFHNWTGNRVTCRDWFQITLKEGLTVFRDQEFSRSTGGGDAKRIEDVLDIRTSVFAEDSGPMAHPIRPESYIAVDNFYTCTVYEKGAEVIRMYETILGKEGFRKGTDLYFERHDQQAVTCDDFRMAMADANGADLTQFERWYSTKGTPVIKVVRSEYNKDNKTFTLEVEQSIPHKANEPEPAPLHIPIKLGLIGRVSTKEVLPSTVLHLKTKAHTEIYENIPEEPVLSMIRNFSAPVKLDYRRPDEDHLLLIAHDTDPVTKYDSSQLLFEKFVMGRAEKRVGEAIMSHDEPLPQRFVKAVRSVLMATDVDRCIQALALRLPSTQHFILAMKPADPDSIFWARHSIKKQLYDCLHSDFNAVYNNLTKDLEQCGEYSVEPREVSTRSLRNLVLSYISTAMNDMSVGLIKRQFDRATNMTDRYAAIHLLLLTPDRVEAQQALEVFFNEAKGNCLMMDKWFACQARSSHKGVIQVVQQLKAHPEFDMKNPNRLRSLFGAFAHGSPHFHRPDGSGYKLVADAVLEADSINDQIASRLCRVLVDWNRYDSTRQVMMKKELQRMLDSDKLSKLTYEVASKGLIE